MIYLQVHWLFFSAFSNLLLGPSSKYFNFVIVFFQLQNSSICNNFYLFIYILILFIYYSHVFFKSFSVFSSNSSSIVKTDVLRLLFSNLNPMILYGQFLEINFIFFLWVGNNFLFLYMSSDLLLKTGHLKKNSHIFTEWVQVIEHH